MNHLNELLIECVLKSDVWNTESIGGASVRELLTTESMRQLSFASPKFSKCFSNRHTFNPAAQ